MKIDELYKKINEDDKNTTGKKQFNLFNKLIKDFHNYEKNGGQIIGKIKLRAEEGRVFWAKYLITYHFDANKELWFQLYEMAGNENIFNYLYKIIEKYNITCDCVKNGGDYTFLKKLNLALKKENYLFIKNNDYYKYSSKKKAEEKGYNYNNIKNRIKKLQAEGYSLEEIKNIFEIENKKKNNK